MSNTGGIPPERVKLATYNNVVRALGRMRIRLHNEKENLAVYGLDKADRVREPNSLIV